MAAHDNPVRKPLVILAGVLSAVLFSVMAWLGLHPEPVYRGKPLSFWVQQLDDGDPWAGFSYRSWRTNLSVEQIQAAEAIRQIGTNALPFLIRAATRKEGQFDGLLIAILGSKKQEREARKQRLSRSWDAALALYVLGPAARPCIPQLKKAYYDYNNEGTARNAAVALAGIGPEGWQVLSDTITNTNWFACFGIWALANQHATTPGTVESLIELFTNNVVFHSEVAAWALAELGEEPERVISVLLKVHESSTDPHLRKAAADALAMFGDKARNAAPSLISALQDKDFGVRYTATNALKAIDPETAVKAGVK